MSAAVAILRSVDKTGPSSAEEFFSRRLGDAQTLLAASRRHAAEGDAVGALATAIGSDMATLQALLWERINMAPRAPQRQMFQAAEALTAEMTGFGAEETLPGASVAELIIETRRRMISALDEALVAEVASRWSDVGFLATFAAPTEDDLAESLARRTDDVPVSEFILQRRSAAARSMQEAQASRVRGATSEAITAAYDSDFLSLEAYLAESAWVLGDRWLFTAVSRWDLVTHAIAEITRLPDGFVDAVALVRRSMTTALGDADGGRLAEVFEPV